MTLFAPTAAPPPSRWEAVILQDVVGTLPILRADPDPGGRVFGGRSIVDVVRGSVDRVRRALAERKSWTLERAFRTARRLAVTRVRRLVRAMDPTHMDAERYARFHADLTRFIEHRFPRFAHGATCGGLDACDVASQVVARLIQDVRAEGVPIFTLAAARHRAFRVAQNVVERETGRERQHACARRAVLSSSVRRIAVASAVAVAIAVGLRVAGARPDAPVIEAASWIQPAPSVALPSLEPMPA